MINKVGGLNEVILPQNMASVKKTPVNTANKFEAMVLQSTLKNKCIDQHFLGELAALSASSGEPIPCSLGHSEPVFSQQAALPPMASPSAAQPSLDAFIQSSWEYAKQAASRLGLDPKVLMAQVALETGWGQSIAKDSNGATSNNLFNIKARKGGRDPSVKINTTEYIDNAPIKIMSAFKAYSSIEHSFDDYVALVEGNHRYKAALANTHDPKQYMDALHEAGYATDPNYGMKIFSIYKGHALEQALKRNGCV